MESAEAVAAKRRVLIDALMMCLSKSRVVQVVDAQDRARRASTPHPASCGARASSGSSPVWKILIAQPGLTAEDVAPPLLVFKAYEGELGVQVRAAAGAVGDSARRADPAARCARRPARRLRRARIEELQALASVGGDRARSRRADPARRRGDASTRAKRKRAEPKPKPPSKQSQAHRRRRWRWWRWWRSAAASGGRCATPRPATICPTSPAPAAGQRPRGRPVADRDHHRPEVGDAVARGAQDGRPRRSWISKPAKGIKSLILARRERRHPSHGHGDTGGSHHHRAVKSAVSH